MTVMQQQSPLTGQNGGTSPGGSGAGSPESLYTTQILALAADIPRTTRLEKPDGTIMHDSPLCGSRVTVDVRVEGTGDETRVVDFGQKVQACLLGQAACAIMGARIVGRTRGELVRVRDTMRAMLTAGGSPDDFDPDWRDLRMFEPARAFKSRHGSIMLAFEAAVMAIDAALEAKARTA